MINESCHLSSKVEIMVSICWIAPYKYRNRLWFGAVLGISAVSATFFCSFPAFWLDFGVLFGEFMRFQLLFSALFRIFGLGLGCCFGDFSIFSYFFLFFSGFLAEFLGAVWGIYAISAPQGPLAMLSTYGYCTL